MISARDVSVLYVSVNGTGNGKYSYEKYEGCGPLDSIDQALIKVDEMRGSGMLQPITIKLLGGEYTLKNPLSVTPNVSNVTFEPFANDKVLISGARKIENFTECTFNGVKCVGAYIEDVKNGTFKFTDLWVNGKRADVTRYPEEGYLHMGPTACKPNEAWGASVNWFTAEEQDLEVLRSLYAFDDCFISFNHFWVDEHSPVEALDKETGKVTLAYYTRGAIQPGQEYIIENTKEMFKKPNQWYLDRQNGMLYYIPEDAKQKAEDVVAYAPNLSELVRFCGNAENEVTGVRFRNITFAYTKGDYASISNGIPHGSDSQSVNMAGAEIMIRHTNNSQFENCVFEHYGLHGVAILDGSHNVRLDKCVFNDGGAGGIKINGDDYDGNPKNFTYGNTVADCTIKHMGRRYLSGCGILSMHSYENDFIHNEIYDIYYTAISCGWRWGYEKTVSRNNRIIGNHLHHIGQGMLSDMGGVYLLGTQPGTIVRGNKIHDIKCKHYGGWALYTDEGSTGMTLEYNLCYRTSSNSYHQHYGSSNVVRNNVFAFADAELLRVSRPEAHLSIMFTNNICLSNGKPMVSRHGYGAKGAYCLEDGAIVSNRNLFWSTGEFVFSPRDDMKTLAEAQSLGLEEDSVVADPLFADAENDDFTLAENSPAFALGFSKYDWNNCGPRK